jgi:hypothetical protein
MSAFMCQSSSDHVRGDRHQPKGVASVHMLSSQVVPDEESRIPAFGATFGPHGGLLGHGDGFLLRHPAPLLGPGLDRSREASKQRSPCQTIVLVRSPRGGHYGMEWAMPGL